MIYTKNVIVSCYSHYHFTVIFRSHYNILSNQQHQKSISNMKQQNEITI